VLKKLTLGFILSLCLIMLAGCNGQAENNTVNCDDSARMFFLENATSRQRMERLLSVTLYNDGRAELALPPISSFFAFGLTFTQIENEVLIHWDEEDNVLAKLEFVDENTLIFTETSGSLFVDIGARYVYTPN
jgi:hypothetical protein